MTTPARIRRALRSLALAGFGIVFALALVGCRGERVTITPPTASPGAAAADGATSTPATRPTLPPDPSRTVRALDEFVRDYGYPKNSTFARLRIPSLSVDAQVGQRYVGGDGVMPDPSGPAEVAWYDLSGWNGLGGRPGEPGNAIFSGHVDYAANVPYAGVSYRGQGVFSQINQLSAGDVIEVDYGGKTFRYRVAWRRQYAGTGTDWQAIWSSNVGRESITLYTCGGTFDFTSREYADRVVVRAERIS